MVRCRFISILALFVLLGISAIPAMAEEQLSQSVQLKAGWYFPAAKMFDPGTGFDLEYSIKPFQFVAVEAGIGYFRAEYYEDHKDNAAPFYTTGYISALPLTVSTRAILPMQFINLYAGGGVGAYYKMVQMVKKNYNMAPGLTELPAKFSGWDFGYHANAGIEFPASNSISLLLDCKYIFVNQGKFKSENIKHDGAFVSGAFALKF